MGRRVFSPRPGGALAVRLPNGLRQLLGAQLRALDVLLTTQAQATAADPLEALTGMTGTRNDRPAPTDPALARLRPDGYGEAAEDSAAAVEFRRLTGGALEALQRARVAAVQASLGGRDRFELDAAEAQAWLGALNDLRLVLGTRLGVTEDQADWPAPDDPRAADFALYVLLVQLQGDLLVALGAPGDY